jgi:hypothetical protein
MDYDRQHMLNLTHLWEMPWGRRSNSVIAHVLAGWQLNGALNWMTGTPFGRPAAVQLPRNAGAGGC